MKFLCGNCKAKYQIADEKISGRTLRMKCRRCQHDIIIRGQEEAQKAAASGGARAPAARRPQAAPAKKRAPQRGSALGADFRRSVGGGPQPKRPTPPPAPPPAELWHVAISDVPVGPIRREEVDKKIQTGAVNGESLCWREGFDDWRPLKDIAELASLLRKQRPPPPSRRPPVGRGIGQRHESRPRIRPSSRPAPVPAPVPAPPPDNVVPIGGRLGGSASTEIEPFESEATRVSEPMFDEDAAGPTVQDPGSAAPFGSPPKPAASLSAVPDMAPTEPEPDPLDGMFGDGADAAPAAPLASPLLQAPLPSQPPPARRKRAIPIIAWIAIAAAGAFGVTLAVFVATNLLREQPQPIADATPVEPAAEVTEAEPEIVLDQETPVPEADVEEEAEPEAGTPAGTGAGMRRGPRPNPATNPSPSMMLTAEQQALIDRMGGEGSAGMNIVTAESAAMSMRAGAPQLTAEQLRSTVNANKRSAQRCYELAIRGAGEPPTIRLDVAVTVAPTGRVSRVNVTGRDFGGLKACIQSNVRRWRFPASGGSTPLQFPLVFQPGA